MDGHPATRIKYTKSPLAPLWVGGILHVHLIAVGPLAVGKKINIEWNDVSLIGGYG